MYNVACFHAQQAVEKAIKAVLTHFHVEFEKVHSIGYLLKLLPPDATAVPDRDDAVRLTQFAVMMRYPGAFDELTKDDQQRTARVALLVVNWAEHLIAGA